MTQARRALPRLLREAEAGALVGISCRDETVAYLVSRGHLEAIVETMETLANSRARRAIDEHRADRTRFLPVIAHDGE